MRAWAVVENGAPLREIEIPTPKPIGTQVLVEVTHCGVCHSDLHNWEGYYDLGGGCLRLPRPSCVRCRCGGLEPPDCTPGISGRLPAYDAGRPGAEFLGAAA